MRAVRIVLTFLAGLMLASGTAFASTAAGEASGARAVDLSEQLVVAGEVETTSDRHRACQQTYDQLASDSLLAARGGAKFPGKNPAKAPKGFEWRGKPGSTPGSKEGNWYNPKTGESLRPDLNHPGPIGPHWDYRDPSGNWFRIFPDGSQVPK